MTGRSGAAGRRQPVEQTAGLLRVFAACVLVCSLALPAQSADTHLDLEAFRLRIATDRAAGLEEGFAALESGVFADAPGSQRTLLWYMAGAAVGSANDEAIADIAARLDGLAGRDPVAAAFAGFTRGARLLDSGRKAEGLLKVLEAAAAVDVSADPAVARTVAGELCRAYASADRAADGLRHCQRLTALVAESGDAAALARAQYLQASVLSTAGRLDESIPLWRSAREGFLAQGLEGLAARTAGSLAGDLVADGQAEEALAMARIALDAAAATGSATSLAFATGPLAEALLQSGDPAAAAAAIEHALGALDGHDLPRAEAQLLRLLEAALSATGEPDRLRHDAIRERRETLLARIAAPAESDRISALERSLREREFELRIRELEQQAERKDLALAAAQLEADLRERSLGQQRTITWLALAGALALLLALASVMLLLRAQRRLGLQLQAMALRDALTGVPNRRALAEAAARIADQDGLIGTGHSLMLVDLDHFKSINDRGGHPFGDRVLVDVASTLTREAPSGALVARLGGEEFAVLCPQAEADTARVIAERMRSAIEQLPFELAGRPVRVTASIGLAASASPQPLDLSRWLAAADAALYRAKEAGRNRVVLAE